MSVKKHNDSVLGALQNISTTNVCYGKEILLMAQRTHDKRGQPTVTPAGLKRLIPIKTKQATSVVCKCLASEKTESNNLNNKYIV